MTTENVIIAGWFTVDPAKRDEVVDSFETESHLNSWRKISNPPKEITPMLKVKVEKHVIDRSGPPF